MAALIICAKFDRDSMFNYKNVIIKVLNYDTESIIISYHNTNNKYFSE